MWSEMLGIGRDIALDVLLTLAVMGPLLLVAAMTRRVAMRLRAGRAHVREQEH